MDRFRTIDMLKHSWAIICSGPRNPLLSIRIGNSELGLGIPNSDWGLRIRIGNSEFGLGTPNSDWEFPIQFGNSQFSSGIPNSFHASDLRGKVVSESELNPKVVRVKAVAEIGSSRPLAFDTVHNVLCRSEQ